MAKIFIPCITNPNDIAGSLKLVEEIEGMGHESGLMLVVRGGMSPLSGRIDLLSFPEEFVERTKVVMLPNVDKVTEGHQTVTFRNPLTSDGATKVFADEVRTVSEMWDMGVMVSFHLNTLVSQHVLRAATAVEWRKNQWHMFVPHLEEIQWAAEAGITLLVETVPIPEFGNLPLCDATGLRDLHNPFFLSGKWGFSKLESLGYGICLDLCHSHTLYEGLGTKTTADHMGVTAELAERHLMDDVSANEVKLIHLNDGRGGFTADGGIFHEGLALGEGEIRDLPDIIRTAHAHGIPMVLEVNEDDHAGRPNARKSLEYIRRVLG